MRRTLLQIDDEPAISAALEIRLRAAGFETISAADGPSGLAAAASERPDVILLDVRMPGMDGLEVCRRLKADPITAWIPVVFLSANAPGASLAEALQAGGAAYLSKPYEAAELVRTIEAVVAAAGAVPGGGAERTAVSHARGGDPAAPTTPPRGHPARDG